MSERCWHYCIVLLDGRWSPMSISTTDEVWAADAQYRKPETHVDCASEAEARFEAERRNAVLPRLRLHQHFLDAVSRRRLAVVPLAHT